MGDIFCIVLGCVLIERLEGPRESYTSVSPSYMLLLLFSLSVVSNSLRSHRL